MPIAATSNAFSGMPESRFTSRSSAGAGRTARLRAAVRTVRATRYATPLREGGSLPGVVEADDDGMYVVKFRGAGQGVKALVAEIIVRRTGRAVGLNVPEIVLVDVDPVLGRAEPDPEIQELIEASAGLNVGSGLPAQRAGVRQLVRRLTRPGRARRLARRADAQHRPHAAQPEPAGLARAAVADRPRRGAVPAPRGRHRRRGAPGFREIADHVSRRSPVPVRTRRSTHRRSCREVPAEWLDMPAASYVSFLEERAAFLA